MKIIILTAVFVASQAFAFIQVNNAQYLAETDQLEIQIQYSGGCFEHRFQLHLLNCNLTQTENMGSSYVCDGYIQDITGKADRCQAIIHRTLLISLDNLDSNFRPILIGFRSGGILIPKK